MSKSNQLCLYEGSKSLCLETGTGTPIMNSNQNTLIKSNQVTVDGDITHNSISFTKEYSDLLVDVTDNKSFMVLKKWVSSAVTNEMETVVENVNQITVDNLRDQDSPFYFNNWVTRKEAGFSMADASIVSIKDVQNSQGSMVEVSLVQGQDKPIDAAHDGKDVLVNLRDSAGKTAEAWNLLATTVLGQKIQGIVDDLVAYLKPLENAIHSGLDYDSNFASQVPVENFSVFGGSDSGVSYLTFMNRNSQLVSFGREVSSTPQVLPSDEKWIVMDVSAASSGLFMIKVHKEFSTDEKDLEVELVNFDGYSFQLESIKQLVQTLENSRALNQLKYGFDGNLNSQNALAALVLVGGNASDTTNGIWNETDAILPTVAMNTKKDVIQGFMNGHYVLNASAIVSAAAAKTQAENSLVSAGTLINAALDTHETAASANTQIEVNALKTLVGNHITALNVDIGKANTLISENVKLKEDLVANQKNVKDLKHQLESLFGKEIVVKDASNVKIDLDNLDSSLQHSTAFAQISHQQSYITDVIF